jgi:hypothetical protein
MTKAKVICNKQANTVAQAFEDEILNRHSCPSEVVTDQGTEFNKEFAEKLQGASVKLIKISPRKSKANPLENQKPQVKNAQGQYLERRAEEVV